MSKLFIFAVFQQVTELHLERGLDNKSGALLQLHWGPWLWPGNGADGSGREKFVIWWDRVWRQLGQYNILEACYDTSVRGICAGA